MRHAREGGIAELNLAGGERDLVGGLQETVGFAVVDGVLVVSDHGLNSLATLAEGTAPTGAVGGLVLAIDAARCASSRS